MDALSSKIRVCFAFDRWQGRAGAELQLGVLLRHIDRNRIEPYVLLLNGGAEQIPELPHCSIYFLHLGTLKSPKILAKVFELRHFFCRNQIDIIQALTIDNPLLTFIAGVGKLSGVKKVFGFRVDIGFWLTPLQLFAGKSAHRFFVDRVIANAEACKKAIIEQEKVKPENIFVVPNLIETERFNTIPAWTAAAADSQRRVGTVANLKPVKGTDIFIQAANIVLQTYPKTQFEIAGTGNIEEHQTLIDQLGISSNVRLLGALSDIPRFLQTLDIAVLSSRSEGLPNAVMEYMAAGRPCVVTDVGGCGELIRNGQNGLLVSPVSSEAVAQGIAELLGRPDRAERFAASAQADIAEKYEAAKLADIWCRIYEEVLQGKR